MPSGTREKRPRPKAYKPPRPEGRPRKATFSKTELREAVLYLAELAVAFEAKGGKWPDEDALKVLESTVDRLHRLRKKRLKWMLKARSHALHSDLASVYRRVRGDTSGEYTAPDYGGDVRQLFKERGLPLRRTDLRFLTPTAAEITADGGPVDSAAQRLATVLDRRARDFYESDGTPSGVGALLPRAFGAAPRAEEVAGYILTGLGWTADAVKATVRRYTPGAFFARRHDLRMFLAKRPSKRRKRPPPRGKDVRD